jgi:hypothetical protein
MVRWKDLTALQELTKISLPDVAGHSCTMTGAIALLLQYISMRQGSHTAVGVIRYSLGSLLALLALNAFAGGYYGLAGAEGVPVEWLEGSPFDSYLIPSLVLFIVVGGSALTAAVAVFRKLPEARMTALLCVCIVFTWLITQVAIIGYVSWMQPATAAAAAFILILTILLSRYDH